MAAGRNKQSTAAVVQQTGFSAGVTDVKKRKRRRRGNSERLLGTIRDAKTVGTIRDAKTVRTIRDAKTVRTIRDAETVTDY